MSFGKCNGVLSRKSSTSSAHSYSYRSGRPASVYIPAPSPLSQSHNRPLSSTGSASTTDLSKPIYFINSYSRHPRYRRDSMDFKVSEKTPLVAPKIPQRGPKAQLFFKTFDIRSTSNKNFKNIEICQNGRPILWVITKAKVFGSPQINLCVGGGLSGGIVAACKFKSVRSGFYVRVGNPDELPPERWPQVTWDWNEKEYLFQYEGRRFCWRSPVKDLKSYLKDNGDYQLVDLENGAGLAAYVKDREWFAFKPIARIDFFVELGQGLELMALAVIMGVEERRRRKTSAAMVGAAA